MSFEVAWKARAPKAPEPEFWERCKEQASLSNIPAWMLAEEGFTHEEVDMMPRSR
jgi:hypothetical protein